MLYICRDFVQVAPCTTQDVKVVTCAEFHNQINMPFIRKSQKSMIYCIILKFRSYFVINNDNTPCIQFLVAFFKIPYQFTTVANLAIKIHKRLKINVNISTLFIKLQTKPKNKVV